MRVLKSAQPEKSEQNITTNSAPAQLSLRLVTILEVISVILTVIIVAWAVVPLRPGNPLLEAIPAMLALALMINSHRLRGETWRDLGFTFQHFGRAIRLLILPMLIGAAIIVTIGYLIGSLHFSAHFWASFAGRSLWGLVQQYALQAFIYRRVSAILMSGQADCLSGKRTWLAIITAALLFTLVHAPNLPLMLLTFVSAMLWTWVYNRAPNLYALAISHGLLSALTAASLPDSWIRGMLVGVRHLVYQAF